MKNIMMGFLFLTACAQSQTKPTDVQSQPPPAATAAPIDNENPPALEKKAEEPMKSEASKPNPSPDAQAQSEKVKLPDKQNSAPAQPPAPPPASWKLKAGKLHGPGAIVASKKISTVKNPKSNGTTSEVCWNYGSFSIVEVQSTDEKGALDLYIRHPNEKDKNLCNPDFRGKSKGVSTIEGNFAGVAGEVLLMEGADSSEGLTEFQIVDIESGKEIYKAWRHPTEDFALHRNGITMSLEYFAKMNLKCELAQEPKECWPKTLKLNQIKKSIPAPNCLAAYKAAGVPLEEPALVTTKGRIKNIRKPNLEWIGGRATCAPAP